jgi:hypothetical protein
MLTVTVAFAQAPTTPAALKLYTSEQIRQMSVDDLFARLGQPEPGYQSNAARLALRAKADTDAATKQQIARRAAELATDAKRTTFERSQVFYLLAALADPATVPILVGVLTGQEQAALRSAAAWALGQMKLAEADEALKQARDQEKDEEVLKWIKRALEPAATPQQVEPQKQARFWLVKDWLRLRNFGPPASNVEFRRFFPVVDDEQIVLGRWLEARDCQTQATVPVSLVKVDADDDQNLIHTIRLASMQQNQEVTVTITAVVARHAKAAPAPPCPLIKADEYPEWARPYLTSTPMVPAGDPLVRQYAGQLLAKSQDAYEIVSQIVALMKGLPSPPKEKWGSHPELSVPAFVLQYGGFGSQGAVTCAALCRACGIPAQLTYYPGQGIMGVVDAYLPGYGYYRVQSAFGAAFMPEQGFIPPRVLNLPLESEAEKDGYMLPYHSAGDKTWVVLSDGRPNRNIRSWNFVQDGKLVQVPEPFPHLECSTVARGLGTEMFEGNWLVWEELTKLSMEAVKGMQLGAFTAIGEKVPTTKTIVDRGLTYKPEEADQQQGQAPQARPGRQ